MKRTGRLALAGGVVVATLVIAHVVDRSALHALHDPAIEQHDWYALLRAAGDLRLWLVVGVAFCLAGRSREGASTAAAAGLAGMAAEGLKLVIGRERPVDGGVIQNSGHYVWKDGLFEGVPGFLGGFADSSNLGIPSSHAAVAFAGCVALGARWPKTLIVLLPVAAGCGLTRMATGAHFLSDVAAGAIIGGVFGVIASGRLRGGQRAGVRKTAS